ncbi:hypothetical protein EH165_12420 [Nakamurella antarctica]|uniref:Uncharacterized protein n=1 Tax=Nakamurella antarctica TaxID=1902245 RepID=A0A3G8ZZ34_9ACTN|nr:hypothetical protein EH165_12420 [Nakamurella antarctica]
MLTPPGQLPMPASLPVSTATRTTAESAHAATDDLEIRATSQFAAQTKHPQRPSAVALHHDDGSTNKLSDQRSIA